MSSSTRPPRTLICLDCWASVYAGEITVGAIPNDPRRFTARQGDDLVLHRRSLIDAHVVGAVCGDLYTHDGVLELAPRA